MLILPLVHNYVTNNTFVLCFICMHINIYIKLQKYFKDVPSPLFTDNAKDNDEVSAIVFLMKSLVLLATSS